MKKIVIGTMLALSLMAIAVPTWAAEPEKPQEAGVQAYKVQLHDTLDREGFIKAYNEANPAYPLGAGSEPKAAGDYITSVSPLGANEAIIINANGEGKLANVIFMHKGKILQEELEQVYGVYAGIINALGYRAENYHDTKYAHAFQELDLPSTEPIATRVTREDNERIYTFYKSYNPKTDVCMILVEAVVEK